MKEIIKEELVSKITQVIDKVKYYVSNDGLEFKYKKDCLDHENKHRINNIINNTSKTNIFRKYCYL